MCLAVPAKVVELHADEAVVDMHGNRIRISTVLTPEVTLDDWVLVHAGFSIQKLDAAAAMETFAILAQAQVVPTPSSAPE
jgi:hydrogenase expression/formation protein HypC